jgi:DNA-binding NarL/FixJ family response regulator
MKYRLLIFSDTLEWSDCLANVFNKNSSFDVLGVFPVSDILQTVADYYPDIILWKLDSNNLLPVIADICAKNPFSRLVVVVRDPSEFDMYELIRSGISGCLPFRLLSQEIVYAIKLVVEYGVLCLPRFGPEYDANNTSHDVPSNVSTSIGCLTNREQDVLTLINQGESNQEIASNLFISESTVKSHLRSIFRKLGVKHRHELRTLNLVKK